MTTGRNELQQNDLVRIDWLSNGDIAEIKFWVWENVAKVLVNWKEIEVVVDEIVITSENWYIYWWEEHVIGLMTTNRSLFMLLIWELEIFLNSDNWSENIENQTELLNNANIILEQAKRVVFEKSNMQIEQEISIRNSREMMWKFDPKNIKNVIEVKLFDTDTCREIYKFDWERCEFLELVITVLDKAIKSYNEENSLDVSQEIFARFITALRKIKQHIWDINNSISNKRKAVKSIMEMYWIKE